MALAAEGHFRRNLRVRRDLLGPALICVHGADVPASAACRGRVETAEFYDVDLAG